MKLHKYQRADQWKTSILATLLQNCTLNNCEEPKASESSDCEWKCRRRNLKKIFVPILNFLSVCSLTPHPLIGPMPIKNSKVFCRGPLKLWKNKADLRNKNEKNQDYVWRVRGSPRQSSGLYLKKFLHNHT